MNKITFTDKAWEEYCYWQTQDKKTASREDLLILVAEGRLELPTFGL